MKVKSFDDISFLMITSFAITSILIMMLFAFSGITLNNNIAMGQTNSTTTGDSGNTAKMHVDEVLKSLQSNDNSGASMHLNLASNSTTGAAKMHVNEALKLYSQMTQMVQPCTFKRLKKICSNIFIPLFFLLFSFYLTKICELFLKGRVKYVLYSLL